jgi:hypothetical protein
MILDTSREPKPRSMQTRTFRKYQQTVRITPDESKRQSDLLRCTWDNLGSKTAVIAFLNTHNDALGGQPLSVALRSEAGLMSARRLLQQMPPAPAAEPAQANGEADDLRRSR